MSNTSTYSAPTSVKRHPIMAVVWGIIGGIGLSLFLMGRAQIPIGKWTWPIVIVVAMIALNLLWTYFGPAKKPKGAPPPTAFAEPEPEPEPETTSTGDDGDSGDESSV